MKYKVLFWLCAALLLAGCGVPSASPDMTVSPSISVGADAGLGQEENRIDFFAMDTYMSIRAFGADDTLLLETERLVNSLEAELSTTDGDSQIHRLNRSGEAELSEDSAFLLQQSLQLCEETGGALDVSIYPVVRAWGFTTADEAYHVPGDEDLQALLEQVDYRRVSLSNGSASLDDGMEIDLGAVTKGYTGDRICSLLKEAGVTSALLDLGGNIQTIGSKPDGSFWRVAIQDPAGDSPLGVLSISDKAVITSGGYERFFIDDNGNLWWHIIDPSTGYPAQNGLISVTIVGEEGLRCDALSTALFIMGPDRAISFWQAHRDFEMALITDDGQLLLTPALADTFTPSSELTYILKVIEDA